MTKTLTEQWREGTLPEDCYYVLTKNGHIKKDRTCFYSHTDEQCFCFIPNKDIEEVLAPMPSYTELTLMAGNYRLAKKALRDCYNEMKYWATMNHRCSKIFNHIKAALVEIEEVK